MSRHPTPRRPSDPPGRGDYARFGAEVLVGLAALPVAWLAAMYAAPVVLGPLPLVLIGALLVFVFGYALFGVAAAAWAVLREAAAVPRAVVTAATAASARREVRRRSRRQNRPAPASHSPLWDGWIDGPPR